MFLSDTHLPQLLRAEHYRAPEQHQRELDQLFLPGWHCIATTHDLPKNGSFITREFWGRPVILWRRGGKIRAFLNVCAHRFSKLTESACGTCERLRCQYHGWEYGDDGSTQKIPDAQSFKPLKKGELGLDEFRCETIGQLVFITFSQEAPPLCDYLGPAYELCQEWFHDDWALALSAIRPNHCNWKISYENSMETYHTGIVHTKTFGISPDARLCRHELLDPSRSVLFVDAEKEPTPLTRLGEWAFRLAGSEVEFDYHQIHVYPNLVFAKMAKISWAEISIPISPTDSREIMIFFARSGRSQGWRARLLGQGLCWWARRFFTRLLKEDEDIFGAIQDGVNAPQQPGPGMISMREERITHFQQWILDHASVATLSHGDSPGDDRVSPGTNHTMHHDHRASREPATRSRK